MTAPPLTALGLVLSSALAAGVAAPATAKTLPSQTVQVSGTVIDETGGVMRAVTVRVFPEASGDPVQETTTDENGYFSVEVAAGAYRVEVSAPAFRTVEQRVRAVPGLEPLDVTLALALEENVDVVDTAAEFRVDPLSSLTTTMLSGDDLAGLPATRKTWRCTSCCSPARTPPATSRTTCPASSSTGSTRAGCRGPTRSPGSSSTPRRSGPTEAARDRASRSSRAREPAGGVDRSTSTLPTSRWTRRPG